MAHLLTFIILFCSLSVQRWSGLKIVLSQEQRKGVKSGNKYLITWTSIIPSSFPQRNSGFFRETGIIASRTNVSTNKRSLTYQWSKNSRFFQRKHYFILASQASTQRNLLNLNLFFPPRWLRPRSRLSPPNPRFIHRRVQGILRSLFPMVSVIWSSGIPFFAKNLLARSITSGKSNRTPLSFIH